MLTFSYDFSTHFYGSKSLIFPCDTQCKESGGRISTDQWDSP